MKSILKKELIALIAIAAALLFFHACKKTNSDLGVNNPTDSVTGSVSGRVTDLNNNPVANASVSAGHSKTTTDIDGQFSIKYASFDRDAGFVQITKPGFFTGSRTFLIKSATINNVKIQLIPKIVSGNFTASSGGTIIISGGGSIDFSGGSVVTASTNAAYSGAVAVSTFLLNTSDQNFNTYMPGDLRGINASGKESLLHPFGMILVEINDQSGNKLQVASGKNATITLPIETSKRLSAPASIPLWFFDDTKGVWKQEGTADKKDSNYVGTVTHFTFWAAGVLGDEVKLDAVFKDSAGIMLTNKLVSITSSVSGTTESYTDDSGSVSGFVPANENLVLKVLNGCRDVVYAQSIGPFSKDVDLGTISISSYFGTATPFSVTLFGTAVTCTNEPVSSGSVTINVGNNFFIGPITNGTFTITFILCGDPSGNPAMVSVLDAVNNKQSDQLKIDVSNNPIQEIGQLTACNSTSTDTYIHMILHGAGYSWSAPVDSMEAHRIDSGSFFNTAVIGGVSTPSKYIVFYINRDNAAPGNYDMSFYANINDSTYNSSYPGNTITTNVTEYGGVNGYISGSASGQVYLGDSSAMPFSISYRVKRVY